MPLHHPTPFAPHLICLLWAACLLPILVGCQSAESDAESEKMSSAAAAPRVEVARDASEPGSSDPQPQADADLSEKKPQAAFKSRDPIDQILEGKTYRRAQLALDNGQWEQARQLQQLLSSSGQFAVLADAIEALTLVKKGQYEQAIAVAEKVSAVPVMQSEALVIVAEAKQAQGQWQDATRLLNVAIQLNAFNVRAHRWLGAIYYDTGAMQLATDHLRKAAELDPQDYRSLRLASKAHFAYERYEDTELDCLAALERQPPEPIALELRLRLAESQRELRKFEEALEVLAKVPELPAALALRASCWESQGDAAQAVDLAEQALRQEPQNAQARLVLGRIAIAERDWAAAIKALTAVTEQDPYDHESKFLLGRALVQQGDLEQGQQLIKESTDLKERFLRFAELNNTAIEKPNDLEVRLEIARLAEALGKPKIAEAWHRAVLGLDPGNEISLAWLREHR